MTLLQVVGVAIDEAALDVSDNSFAGKALGLAFDNEVADVVGDLETQSSDDSVSGTHNVETAVSPKVMRIDDEPLEVSLRVIPSEPLTPASSNLVGEGSSVGWEGPDEAVDVASEHSIAKAILWCRQSIELSLDRPFEVLE